MPANLTPEFLKARKRLRYASSTEEKLAVLEEMLATIPKHKGTDKMQADIKRRIAKLRGAKSHSKRGKSNAPDHIDREGAGQVVLLGPPNSGKSSLLAALTNAHPETADYPFSTLRPIPGMMSFEDIAIQLVDLPPITSEYTEPWVYNLVRQSDLALVLLDGSASEEPTSIIKGILSLMEEHHIEMAESVPEEREETQVKEVPCRIVLTKGDLADHHAAVEKLISFFPILSISATTGAGLDKLREEVFTALNVIRIYTKLPGKPPDMSEPYTLSIGSTVLDAVKAVHRDFVNKFKYVRIWGSGKFDGQQVHSDHVLQDKDIIEIHLS